MKKRVLALTAALVLLLCGCGAAKILHCDGCGKELRVKASSNMEEDWILYCDACNEEFFGDDPLLGNG